jgi:hypothetical protein
MHRNWGMAQVVKSLPSKGKALNSNHNTAKKRKLYIKFRNRVENNSF